MCNPAFVKGFSLNCVLVCFQQAPQTASSPRLMITGWKKAKDLMDEGEFEERRDGGNCILKSRLLAI